jgi:hypothetical protein
MSTAIHTSASRSLRPSRQAGKPCEGKKQRLKSEPRKTQRQKLMTTVADTGGKLSVGAPVIAPPYMTTAEAAQYLKLSRQFLEAARYRGDGSGPTYVKLERAVRYRRSVLDAWMSAHDHSPEKPSQVK